MTTTVALVDDHKLFREGLRALLQSQPGFSVVAEATNADEAYRARPFALNGNRPTRYSRPVSLTSRSVRPTAAISGHV